MDDRRVQLSVEELAYAMGVLGGPDMASGFLLSVVGERPQPETQGRLLAASHSLVARGLLDFDIQSGAKSLSEDFARLVRPLLSNDFSLRCNRSSGGQETTLSVFFAAKCIVAHERHRAIVSRLNSLTGADAVVAQCVSFFGLPGPWVMRPAEKATPLAVLPVELVNSIHRNGQDLSAFQIASQLIDQGVTVSVAPDLAQDFKTYEYRGSAIRIEMGNRQAVADQGFLILKAVDRYWIFDIVAETPPVMKLYEGTPAVLSELFARLMS